MLQPYLAKAESSKQLYDIPYSLCMDYNSSSTLTKTFSGDESAKQWTVSWWFKIGQIYWITATRLQFFSAYKDAGNYTYIQLENNNKLEWKEYLTGGGKETNAVFYDPHTWYHLVILYDSEEVATADRYKLYVNGVLYDGTWQVDSGPVADNTTDYFTNVEHMIGNSGFTNSYYDGFLAEFHAINGSVQEPTEFGEFINGIWRPKEYTGAYGTNGFYLDFSNSAHFGEDQSGNGNDFTDTNLAAINQTTDSPTHNHCTLNCVERRSGTSIRPSLGGLRLQGTMSSDWSSMFGTWAVYDGKWYWEVTYTDSGTGVSIGVCSEEWKNAVAVQYPGYTGTLGASYWSNGDSWLDGSQDVGAGASYTLNDVIGVALDMDNLTIDFYKNNVFQFQLALTADSMGYVPCVGIYNTSQKLQMNFGQLGFGYTPPANFIAMSTEEVSEPDSAIFNSNKGADVVLWTGDGTDNKDIAGLEFEPNLVWAKRRDSTTNGSHRLYDQVRGVNQALYVDTDAVEFASTDELTAFNADGFEVGATHLNIDTATFVAWCLKEGVDYGFDIVAYSGDGEASQLINHSLGVVPEMIIVKRRTDDVDDWIVYHHDVASGVDPETDHGILSSNVAWADDNTMWNDTAPTTTQFTVGTADEVNDIDSTYIAYVFAGIIGFSSVFTYIGNADDDGPYVNLGFRPRWLFIKNVDAATSWQIIDTEREPWNLPPIKTLQPDTNAAEEESALDIHMHSNGFKIRTTSNIVNGNTQQMIGVAFAEQPFKHAVAR